MKTFASVMLASAACMSFGTDIYVNASAPGGGNGTQVSPYKLFSEAIAVAGAGDTILVAGQTYPVNSEAEVFAIPAGKDGLVVRNLPDSDRVQVPISNTYISDGNRLDIVSVQSEHVTLSGFTFSYGKDSIGIQKVASAKLVVTDAPFLTIDNCEFYCTGTPGNSGSGAGGIIFCGSDAPNTKGCATNLVVQNCYIHNVIGIRGDYGRDPICVYRNATVRNCVFEDVWGVASAANNGQFKNFSFISNLVFVAKFSSSTSFHSLSNGAQASGALFHSAYRGLGDGAEIAHNIFIGNGSEECGMFNKYRYDGFSGTLSFHHNTVDNFGYIWGYYDKTSNSDPRKTVIAMYDNIIGFAGNGIVFRDEGYKAERINGNTFAKAGSYFRNNVVVKPYSYLAGFAGLDPDYNFSTMSSSDNLELDDAPPFRDVADRTSEDFYRLRTCDAPWSVKQAIRNISPVYVGAVEPQVVPMGTSIIMQ